MLQKILIFKVCRLLAMMKTLAYSSAYSSQDQGKSTFLDRTSVENIRGTGVTYPVAALYLSFLPVCQCVSLICCFVLNFFATCTFWEIWSRFYFPWPGPSCLLLPLQLQAQRRQFDWSIVQDTHRYLNGRVLRKINVNI